MRFIAFLLLLAFFQKMGLELWLHHLLHEPQGIQASVRDSKDKALLRAAVIQCNCLDDTLMPLIQSEDFVYAAPQKHFSLLLTPSYASTLSRDKVFLTLRGPPVSSIL